MLWSGARVGSTPSRKSASLPTVLQVWDMRVKRSVQTLPEKYQVCAVAFADAGDQVSKRLCFACDCAPGPGCSCPGASSCDMPPQSSQVYTGGIDNTIKVWDLRKEEVSFTLEGHGDTITGMRAALSQHLQLGSGSSSL
jgi:Prp8 binding protein